jgi:uncharacterized protein YhaN
MNAERSLFDAYREWRRLAKACRKAICQRNWAFLLECQGAIRKLQPFITTVTQEARNEWKRSHVDRAAKETELRGVIFELEELAESNKKLLQAARAVALSKREQLERAGRNLRRIQSSYGSAQRPALRGVA